METFKLNIIVYEATIRSNEQNYGDNIYIDLTETTF